MLSGQSEEVTARRAAAFEPDVVGFSAMSPGDLASIGRMSRTIDELSPERPLRIVGGTLAATEPHTIAQSLPGDFVCIRFEGEEPLLRILRGPRNGERAAGNGTLAGAPIADLDALPDAERPMAGALVARGRTLNVQASRGCTGSCAYCCAPSFPYPPGRRWRARSPERTVDEIATLHRRFGAVGFNFVDDDFLGPPTLAAARAAAFRDAFASRRLRVAFGVQVRPRSLSVEAIASLVAAGLAYVLVGFETDDATVLRGWGRRHSGRTFWSSVRRLRAAGVEVQVGCIPFHPQATVTAVKRLMKTLAANEALNYRTATNRLQLLPGSRLSAAAGVTSASTPPMACPTTEQLHDALVTALQPIRPCWVHAISLLPHSVVAERASERGRGPYLAELRNTLAKLDRVVAKTASALIAVAERGDDARREAVTLQRANVVAAESAAHDLASCGAVVSYDLMRTVIRSESGL
jgi:hypothetical protein